MTLVKISIDDKAQQALTERFRQIAINRPVPPDFGNDDLHNARLVGAYHARRGAGGDYLDRWRRSLWANDFIWIMEYENRAEWGNTNIPGFTRLPVIMPHHRVTAEVDQRLIQICAILPRPYLEVKQGFTGWLPTTVYSAIEGADYCRQLAMSDKPLPWEEGYGEEPVSSGHSLLRVIADDPEGFLIIVERINLRHNLERIMIPASVACWLAKRWPVWALPAVVWVRAKRWWGKYERA